MNASANVQTVTVRLAARALNISERLVYMGRELLNTGRDDLVRDVEGGRLSLHGALALAKPAKYGQARGSAGRLLGAWRRASDADRAAFLAEIGAVIEREQRAARPA
jgi:hypothetical protein